ncbi:hypothetical protein G5V58_13340 [Nocardioides anomalus]|uniref:Uncharacterized protein n=1 Tax=Nocardioides anomalus TaxID=2712223 RepID=A0A6G6WE39_9ACTN|nr:hypothetical protein [Nocardioides anomalus]QIG43611.1 hypothetical protein G5V58_13340 [Nocardioides anomalus]
MVAERLHVTSAAWTGLSASAEALVRAELGRAAPRDVEALLVAAPHGWPLGDELVQLIEDDDGRVWVHPPATVLTAPRPVRGGRGTRLQLLRTRPDLRPVPIGMATASFRAAQVREPRPLAEGPVRSAEVRQVLLGLWALDT